ncbi:MAG: hypothetical protein ACLFRL_03845 [Desulfohalobiaceae bacterium]
MPSISGQSWPKTVDQARRVQDQLLARVSLQDGLPASLRFAAGLDASYLILRLCPDTGCLRPPVPPIPFAHKKPHFSS